MRKTVFLSGLLIAGLALAACDLAPRPTKSPAPISPTATPTATIPADLTPITISGTPVIIPSAIEFTPTPTTAAATPAPTRRPTQAPQPSSTPLPSATTEAPAETQPTSTITVKPVGSAGFPIGSTAKFHVELSPQVDTVTWKIDQSPDGITARLVSDPQPWASELIVTADPAAAPGDYAVTLGAYQGDSPLASAQVTFTLTGCGESPSGEMSASIKDSAARVILAGKPDYATGLIVPFQVCRPGHLSATLTRAVSETGVDLADAPPFHLFRSIVYPAPAGITANPGSTWILNVENPRVVASGWSLDADVPPGLYLLVFQNDRWPGTPPESRPDAITFSLAISH